MGARSSVASGIDEQGFTVLELMLALVMTTIVAAVGMSAYRTYSIRAQIDAAIFATENLRIAVADLYLKERRMPAGEHDGALRGRGANSMSRFVGNLRVVEGRIDLTYGSVAAPAIAGRTLSLTPYETADLKIVWICGNRIPGTGLKPLGFSAGGPEAVQIATTIEARYLPPDCR